ncbi:MAG: four helix bundle protein [Candidatus Moranbacteria bacterium CG10_big_fil_rev_8_21_14_0_10_35_21]|nr:MAG: four helix bundle protein [Candidatus Moranbacteria bacterium CG10_big_fil_rev_8_21_14_0_10_35_21]PJA88983.1 MAG: four helix bundle protein [Candidatus Moranbacteria bacterium CG_4_9_14_3_um_filter_36_9]
MNTFHDNLRTTMDRYVHFVYRITKKFPKDELYGVISQIRRSSLSVILNYIEGFARTGEKSRISFYKISYASLKESKYLLHFSLVEKYLNQKEYNKALELADKIGAMLLGIIRNEK